MTIQAIQTEYKGYKFRSRLEARWAVFFDALDVRWEYEKEGYEFDDGTKYLPDFWLPKFELFIEVKGMDPSENELHKVKLLREQSGHDVALVIGIPPEVKIQWNGFMEPGLNKIFCSPVCMKRYIMEQDIINEPFKW